MARENVIKKRGQIAYERKVDRVTFWYNRLVELREKPVEPNKDKEHPDKALRIRKPLKDLDFYISKIKKITN